MKEEANFEKDLLLDIEISFKQDVIFAWKMKKKVGGENPDSGTKHERLR